MNSYSDDGSFEIFCYPFDQGSEAFRQKMFSHFESLESRTWAEAGQLPERDEPTETSGFLS